jgi:hypothetical protein
MRASIAAVVVAVTSVLAAPSIAAAGDPQAGAAPPPAPSAVGVHAYAAIDGNFMSATHSFEGVLGTANLIGYGGGVDIVDVWKHLFVRLAVTHASDTGSRAIFTGTETVSLGVPLTVSMTPIEIGGGWRFTSSRGRLAPYVGGGALVLSYKETSQFADASENVSDTFVGYDAFGGVELGITKWLLVGGEAQYRGVPNAIGDAGLSQAFNETNLGGFTARFTIGVRLR